MNYLEEYKKCAEICQDTDFGNKRSVRAHNAAVDRMYEIVEQASMDGSEAIANLISLLDDDISSKWIAHHIIEKAEVDPGIRKKCFKIIEKIASIDGPDAFGEKIWLEEWKK
jgi:hypothetical protein